MRVLMGEIIDVNSDLTTKHLTIQQKISVLWQSMVSDSKILGNRRKAEAEKAIKERNNKIDRLRDGLLASLEYHLTSNRTLYEMNEEAVEIELALERSYKDVLSEVLASHEFNSFETEEVSLDSDIVNSFGDRIPIIIAFKMKEV